MIETHFARLEQPTLEEGFSRVDQLAFNFEPAHAEEALALQRAFLVAD